MKKKGVTQYGILLLTTALTGTAGANDVNVESEQVFGQVDSAQVSELSPESHLKNLVMRSDLVFHGKLIDISEGLSIEKIPYTFATYRIKEVVAGGYRGDTITLKFVGGKFPNGNRLTASNSPKIKLGEESILIVQQSADTGCDLVDCEGGRFLIDGGVPIAANNSAVIVRGNGKIEYKDPSERNEEVNNSNSVKPNAAHFIGYLRSLAQASNTQRKVARKDFVNNNKEKPFKAYAALTRTDKAPEMIDQAVAPKASRTSDSEFDKWETEQFNKNAGNPLLNVSKSDSKK